MSGIPKKWKNWIVENLLRGVDASALLKTLLKQGFCFDDCKTLLGSALPASVKHPRDAAFYQVLSQPRLLTNPPDQLQQIPTTDAQLFVLDDFLSPEECDYLIALTKSKLRPSEITSSTGYEGFRTSSTCDLTYTDDPAAREVDTKIIDCLGSGVGEGEVIQAQHYAPGQQFKAHTDYFEPATDEYLKFSAHGGQRTWTFMVYLNDACTGGETTFPDLKQTFTPKQGRALIWNNLLPNGRPNKATLHQAHPVETGEKVVITKWFRDGAN